MASYTRTRHFAGTEARAQITPAGGSPTWEAFGTFGGPCVTT
jgi:hypothetical protein